MEFAGRQAWALAEDLPGLLSPPEPEDPLLLLSGHDPYLDQRDRATLTGDKARAWAEFEGLEPVFAGE